MKKIITLGLFILGCSLTAPAQSVTNVTEIVTDYKGFWQTGDGTAGNAIRSTVVPDNSHNLLAFRVNKVLFSTGVNDALLTSKKLSFTAAQFRALPVSVISGVITSNTKIGLGQLYDGVHAGASNPAPAGGLPRYLTDGINGLDIGTCVANIPAGTLTFTINSVTSSAIGDNVPDILVTQVADPNNSTDTYSFLGADNQVIGKEISVSFVGLPVVGRWVADFYDADVSPMKLTSNFTNTERDLRLWGADFSQFGINQSNYAAIRKFQIKLAGSSDVAFVAYNTRAVTVLPVQLTSFSGAMLPTGEVALKWRTASELNSEAFVVESSTDGRTFAPVGRVAAAGTKSTVSDYSYLHRASATGLIYYRLHQLDLDGSSAYSPVVVVKVGSAWSTAGQASPNPFSQSLQLRLTAGAAKGEAHLLAMDGRLVHQRTFTANELIEGACTLNDLATLQPGIYMLRILLDGQATVQKVVKQ